jgi:hypothetical protein
MSGGFANLVLSAVAPVGRALYVKPESSVLDVVRANEAGCLLDLHANWELSAIEQVRSYLAGRVTGSIVREEVKISGKTYVNQWV